MKRTTFGWMAALLVAGAAAAQDMPGFSVGGFYETRIDNRVTDENLAFDFYGGRVQFRDERWFTVFVDVGAQSAEWEDYEAGDSTFFGLGGTLWFARADDLMIPMDVGVFGSFHKGDLDLDDGADSHDATYATWTAQAVARLVEYDHLKPFLRAGVRRSDLDGFDVGDDGDWTVLNPAVNVGVEIEPADQFVITLEGNFSESAGVAIRADLWF